MSIGWEEITYSTNNCEKVKLEENRTVSNVYIQKKDSFNGIIHNDSSLTGKF